MSYLKFTDSALKHLSGYLVDADALGVRFAVKHSGCSGYKYISEVMHAVKSEDILVHEAPDCYVDKASLKMLTGMTVDHKVDKFGSGLVYINPNAQGICGCGESFGIEDD